MKPVRLTALLLAASAASAQQPSYKGLGAESVPPALVAKYAAPPLAPAVSRRIQTMLDVRTPGLGIVAPDGAHLYFGWRITGSRRFSGWTRRGLPGADDGGRRPHVRPRGHARGKWLVLVARRRRRGESRCLPSVDDGGPLKTVQKTAKVQTFATF